MTSFTVMILRLFVKMNHHLPYLCLCVCDLQTHQCVTMLMAVVRPWESPCTWTAVISVSFLVGFRTEAVWNSTQFSSPKVRLGGNSGGRKVEAGRSVGGEDYSTLSSRENCGSFDTLHLPFFLWRPLIFWVKWHTCHDIAQQQKWLMYHSSHCLMQLLHRSSLTFPCCLMCCHLVGLKHFEASNNSSTSVLVPTAKLFLTLQQSKSAECDCRPLRLYKHVPFGKPNHWE